MSVTPEQLAEKRQRAEELRRETAALELAMRNDQANAELAAQGAALDEEIARLEREREEKMNLARRQGGSVAEALAAMEAAENKAAAELKPSARPSLGANPEGEDK